MRSCTHTSSWRALRSDLFAPDKVKPILLQSFSLFYYWKWHMRYICHPLTFSGVLLSSMCLIVNPLLGEWLFDVNMYKSLIQKLYCSKAKLSGSCSVPRLSTPSTDRSSKWNFSVYKNDPQFRQTAQILASSYQSTFCVISTKSIFRFCPSSGLLFSPSNSSEGMEWATVIRQLCCIPVTQYMSAVKNGSTIFNDRWSTISLFTD